MFGQKNEAQGMGLTLDKPEIVVHTHRDLIHSILDRAVAPEGQIADRSHIQQESSRRREEDDASWSNTIKVDGQSFLDVEL